MLLDGTYTAEVRRRIPRLTLARLSATTLFRFTAPLLATIARGFHVSLSTLGVAVTISELVGLSVPSLARLAETWPRRRTMQSGMCGLVLGAAGAALTTGPVSFAAALMLIALSKNVFDIGTNAWVSDHVPYEGRARIIGITEMSWSGGLLVGVPILLVAAAITNWRGGYILGGVFVVICAFVFVAPFPREPPVLAVGDDRSRRPMPRSGIPTVIAVGLLMAASQSGFVTFGSWLHDRFGFGDGALGAVAFLLGGGELVASFSTSRLTDRWGKRQSVQRGAALMVPVSLLLAGGLSGHIGAGVPLLIVFFIGFEFAVVSSISLTSNLIPGRPAAGIGIGIGAGTFGRAAAAIPATRLYDAHGFGGAMLLAACCAAASACLLVSHPRAN